MEIVMNLYMLSMALVNKYSSSRDDKVTFINFDQN